MKKYTEEDEDGAAGASAAAATAAAKVTIGKKIKDDSDYLAFKETTLSLSKFVYRSVFLSVPVPPLSAHSNLLYDDNKYANGITICTSSTNNVTNDFVLPE